MFDNDNFYTRINRGLMSGEENRVIAKELGILKNTVEERWKAHDKRSDEIWTEIKGNIKGIFHKLDNLPCDVHRERWDSLMNRVNWLYGFVTLVLIGGVVLGIWFKAVH